MQKLFGKVYSHKLKYETSGVGGHDKTGRMFPESLITGSPTDIASKPESGLCFFDDHHAVLRTDLHIREVHLAIGTNEWSPCCISNTSTMGLTWALEDGGPEIALH
jgi:hypothetical protein